MKGCMLIVLSAILTGCTGMSSNFQCNVPSGGLCASMSQVNDLVDENQLPGLVQSKSSTYVRVGGEN